MGKILEFPSGPNNSPQLEKKFSEQQRDPLYLKSTGDILSKMEVDKNFAQPVAEMLFAINATAAEIMGVKKEIEGLKVEGNIIELGAKRKRVQALQNVVDLKNVA